MNKVNQKQINKIWSEQWNNQKKASIKDLFKQRLFVEGLQVYKKYIPSDAKKILEIGAGTGRYGISFAKENQSSSVILTDITQDSIDLMNNLIKQIGLQNVETKKEDVMCLSFPDNYFDVVFCDVVIQHLSDPTLALKEMTRVLAPGGRLIISAVNIFNFHSLYKYIYLPLRSKKYDYGYEKSYTHNMLRQALEEGKYLEVDVSDGFYVAYGVYRWKYYGGYFFDILGRVVNRIVKYIDRFSNRFLSKKFGFIIFAVAVKKKKTESIYVNNSSKVRLYFFNDYPDGNLAIGESERSIDFDIKRVYYITNLHKKEAKRGFHAHKKLVQYIFAISGSFDLELDDGFKKQVVTLDSPYDGVKMGPLVWHTMTNFSHDCVILVVADDYYDESDYIRNYDDFLNFVNE